jgi:hypothetical protein
LAFSRRSFNLTFPFFNIFSLPEGFGHPDGSLVHGYERSSQKELGNQVRRGQNGGGHKNNQNGILPISGEEWGRNDSHPGKEENQSRPLEKESEGQEEFNGESQIFPDGRKGTNFIGGKAEEEAENGGKDDEVAKEGPQHKEKRRYKKIGENVLFFPPVKAGGDESPNLVEDEWGGEKYSREYGRFKIGKKSLGNGGKDKGAPRGQSLHQRAHQNLNNFFDVGIANGESDSNGREGVDESFP